MGSIVNNILKVVCDQLPVYGAASESLHPVLEPAVLSPSIGVLSTLQTTAPQAICSPSPGRWNVEEMLPSRGKQPVRRALFGRENGDLVSPEHLTGDSHSSLIDSTPPDSHARHLPNSPVESPLSDAHRVISSEGDTIDVDDPGTSFIMSANEIPEEITPTGTQRKKRRVTNFSQRASEKAKQNFNSGVEDITPKGYKRKARTMGPGCKTFCRICKEKIPVEARAAIFKHFWKLDSVHRKRDFISRSVSTKKPATCSTTPSRAKKSSRRYSLTTIEGPAKKYFVCKTMFIQTLGISDCWVETSLKKCQRGDGQSPDKRGKHKNRVNRVPEGTLASVRRHINMFARVPSHYTRERTKREYLEPHIKSVERMNRMVFSMYMLAAAKSKHKITHRFLESGHSFSEADSMHARIENEALRKEIFTPEEWMALIEGAKQEGKKYIINKLKNENVSDLHFLVDRQNWDRNTNNEQVLWSKVREVVVDWKSPNTILYRYGFSELLKTVVVKMKDGSEMDLSMFVPPQAYQSRFPLTTKKKNDLKFLCQKKAIPSKYHSTFDEYLAI
ncbi:Nuclear receptor coactivator 3 [Frankliniella fusca]|uniref:Nuclear receptor coactivator 3 n=1 Tax=Frankliniella fusca TaxID=407009 RepID=A0AAE1HXM2_9NEOP|nr:Nuclear receptor coactivator 3 [Frankliniella fusca]